MERHGKELSRILEEHLPWHYARLECVYGMMLAMVSCGSLQLNKIAGTFLSGAKPDSRIKRCYRLIRFQDFDFTMIGMAMLAIICLPRPYTLTMDRTNWQHGKESLNFLVLAAVYQGMSIPLLWINLGCEGNSSTKERIALLERALKIFPSIVNLSATIGFYG
jgi:hypothetical protein